MMCNLDPNRNLYFLQSSMICGETFSSSSLVLPWGISKIFSLGISYFFWISKISGISFSLSTTALFVVDDQTTGSIDWIHPCQVRSIDVLKDGNAAIYGSRGGNGVILIELVK